METVFPQPLPEKLEKTLKIADEEACGSDDSMMIEEEDPYDFNVIRRKSKQIVKDFLKQVQDNRFSEFPWPPDPDCAALKYGYIEPYLEDLTPEEEETEGAKRFMDQIRKSWGYDVDYVPPGMVYDLLPIDLDSDMDYEIWRNILTQAKDCVMNQINAEANNIGKAFEFVRLHKAVSFGLTFYLLTLTIKDVKANAEKNIRATVARAPCHGPDLMECKLISAGSLETTT